jgi:DNA polymerase (family 10)
MGANDEIAARLNEIAQLMELLGEDGFRVNAHTRAARAVESLAEDITLLAQDRTALLAVEGIGPKIADKIIEYCTGGAIAELDALREKVPKGLPALLALPGVGPKTVRALWQDLHVTDLAGLERVIADGTILKLPRMGEKAVQKIKDAIALASQGQERLHLGRAWEVAQRIAESLRTLKGVALVEPAGSLRRGRETVGDLDFVVAMDKVHDVELVMDAFTRAEGVERVIVKGETKSSVRVRVGGDSRTIQADVRVVPRESFGSALQYFTGSKEHNVRVRALAQEKGWTLNEWGLFKESEWRAYHDAPKGKSMPRPVVPCGSEEQVYKALGLTLPPPETREGYRELERAEWGDLVAIEDIASELHAHTDASDGALSIEGLARAAHARGFHTVCVTDHSQSSTIARGLKPDRMRAHIDAVREADQTIGKKLGIRILAGSEVDILADGSLDYKDELLKKLDIVVASPHAALSQDSSTATKRLLRAIEHPLVHVLGHPTGRLILQRRGLEPSMGELFAAAKEHDVAMEINSHWLRLDLRDSHVRQGVEADCLFAIDCDVHAPGDFDNLRFGIATARRGMLNRERCVNSWGSEKLRAWLQKKRG